MFGNPETTTGGRALKFYSSVRIDIRRIAAIKDGDVVVGLRTKVKVVKNKVARRSAKPSSTSCTAKASRAKATCSIWRAHNIVEKVRLLVQLQGRAHRPGTRECWSQHKRPRSPRPCSLTTQMR
jgi:recombination protein RecA